MPNPVIVADLEARFRPLSDVEQTNAQAWLDDAWEVVLENVPSVEERLAAGTLRTGLIVKVVSAMVLRVLRNPEGLRQWSIDDASFTRDQALSTGALYLAPEEAAELSSGSGTSTAFTIRPVVDYSAAYVPDPWAPLP